MAQLSMAQVASYAKGAGFSGNALITAVAVAYAESTNNPKVINYLGCVGLWQIYGKVHRRTYKSWSNSWLQNPANNAKAAYILSKGGKNWRPWEAWANGAYKKYLSAATTAIKSVPSVTPVKTATPTSGVTAAKVLSIAASQIGYRERSGNRTKYWTDLGINQGQPWCGGFVTWCLWKAGYSLPKIRSMAGPNPYHVWTIKAYAKKHKRWTKTPKPGYLAIFTFSHVELVEKVSGNSVQTIGGNTSSGRSGSQSNGGGVYRRPNRKGIAGYVRIDYDAGGPIPATSPDWAPGVDAPRAETEGGYLVVNAEFNASTSAVLARYFGFDAEGTTTTTAYWKKIEEVAKFPVRWQNGKLDQETIQFLQWATEQRVTSLWNATFIRGMQNFLNAYTKGEKPSYASMIAAGPK